MMVMLIWWKYLDSETFQTSLAGCGCLPTENSFQAGVRSLRGQLSVELLLRQRCLLLLACVTSAVVAVVTGSTYESWTERKPAIQTTVLTFVATNNATVVPLSLCVRPFWFMIWWRSYRLFLMEIFVRGSRHVLYVLCSTKSLFNLVTNWPISGTHW